MTNVTDFTFLSSDGKTSLHATEWVPADREIVAVLQIAHGVAEYIGRYDGFARFLNEQGIAVVGNDHLGHGLSLPYGATPVYFGDGNTWQTVVDDLHLLHDLTAAKYPNVPYFFMGHSMGSFLARSYLIRYPGTVRAAIIMGTGWQPEATVSAGLAIAGAIAGIKGPAATSNTVKNLAFGAYNKPFAPVRTEFDWLSVDTDNVDRYAADPMCGQPTSVGLFREMLKGFRFNQKTENLQKMDKATPVLFVSGDKDPVGDMGKGVQRSYAAFRQVGVQDATLMLFPGLRHEILNESAHRQEVFAEICGWLKKYL